MVNVYVHPSAEVSPTAQIGEGTRIWHETQVRERACLGKECNIGKGVYVDFDVVIGNRCKLQNGVYVFHGAILEDGVFLGPGAMLLNDRLPRAINPDGTLKDDTDWKVSPVYVATGAAVGGGAVITPGITVGRWAIVGAGAVVTHNVPDFALVYGNPARVSGYLCPTTGRRLKAPPQDVEPSIP